MSQFFDYELKIRTEPFYRQRVQDAAELLIKTSKDITKGAKYKKLYEEALVEFLHLTRFNLSPLLGYYYPRYPDGNPYSLKDFPFANIYYSLNIGAGSSTVYRASRQIGKCLNINNLCKFRNKRTGEVVTMPIGEFFEKTKNLQKNCKKMS